MSALPKVELADYQYSGNLDVYFAISRQSELIKRQAELEAALQEMLDSGEVEKILNSNFKE